MPSAVQVKVIKPEKLKDDKLRLTLLNALRKAGTPMKQDFVKTTETWEHKPKFEVTISLKQPGPSVSVGTEDKIYEYVNDGTAGKGKGPTYPIPKVPKVKGALRFRWGGKGSYKSKTKPRVIGSTPGGPSGPWVSFKQVQHPGIKPRAFDKVIQKKWKPRFEQLMEKAMQDAAKASGHGIP